MTPPRMRALAAAATAGLISVVACILLLVVAAVAMRADGLTRASVGDVTMAGSPAVVLIAALAMLGTGRGLRFVQRLRAEHRTLDALERRIRMADEVAERNRKMAQNAGAGMFELLSGLVAAEEGARGQLSAELHDTVAQSLAAARSMIDDNDPESVTRAAEYVADAEEQVRALMARTRPPALRDGDLARAVASLRDDLHNRYAMKLELSWPLVAYPLPLVTAITVYRFFQEALLNVVKHADVDDARAALWVDDEWVMAEVTDAGTGFDPESVTSEGGRHVGLGLLRERARLVGGSLDVVSWRGEGTTLTLRLPRDATTRTGVPLQSRLPLRERAVAERAVN